jgi:hypothetical protein
VIDLLVALITGVVAACTVAFVDLNLRIPGHAILKAVFPISLGFAFVPRRATGLVMMVSALASLFVLRWGSRLGVGVGATTSLLALGPLLDLLLWRAQQGPWLSVRFALAGLLANLAAFAVRGGSKAWGEFGLRPLEEWLTVAPWTYAFCGLVAGLISGLCFFHLRTRSPRARHVRTTP